nr:uncharacterized protein LOC124496485 [Dermatophagoides farinae]
MISIHYSTMMTNLDHYYGHYNFINKIIIGLIFLQAIITVSNSMNIHDSTIVMPTTTTITTNLRHPMDRMPIKETQSPSSSIIDDHHNSDNTNIIGDNDQDENNNHPTITTTTNRILNRRLQNCWTNLSRAIGLVCSNSSSSSSKFMKLLKENYFGILQKRKHPSLSIEKQQILIDCCIKPCSIDRIRTLC